MTERDESPRPVFATPGGVDGGGMGRVTGYIVDQLRATGYDPVVLDTRGGGHVALSPFRLAAALGRLAVLGLTRRAGVVHINVSERGSVVRKALVLAAARALGVPTVMHLHGANFVEYFESGGIARGLSRWLFSRSDRVIVLGDGWRDYLVHTVGIGADKVHVLHNAVPDIAPVPGPALDPPGETGRPLRLLILANLCERKGIGTALRAAARLKAQGVRFRLLFGGAGDVEGYTRMARDLGVGAEAEFLGWVTREQAHALIRSSDMLLLPSTHEGLPMVILEALCARLPVVATPVGSIPEVLADRETALIVPVNDAEALAGAVAALAGDAGLRTRLAAAGRRLFEQLFQIEGYCLRLQAIHRAAAGGEAPGTTADRRSAAYSGPR